MNIAYPSIYKLSINCLAFSMASIPLQAWKSKEKLLLHSKTLPEASVLMQFASIIWNYTSHITHTKDIGWLLILRRHLLQSRPQPIQPHLHRQFTRRGAMLFSLKEHSIVFMEALTNFNIKPSSTSSWIFEIIKSSISAISSMTTFLRPTLNWSWRRSWSIPPSQELHWGHCLAMLYVKV